MARALHPKLAERAAAVKHAHAHLKATVNGFDQLQPKDRVRMVHAHIGRNAASYLKAKAGR